MTVLCVGLSHKQAPIAVREQLALNGEALTDKLTKIRGKHGVHEVFIVSTCNRLEVFAWADSRAVADDVLHELGPVAAPYAVVRAELEAVRHLFRVTASLDSMVVGEAQIQGQVKDAAAKAHELKVMGPELNKALMRAMTAAKRVRTETELARGAVSISSVAVDMARKLLGELSGKSVLLLGAGEMAQLAARELRQDGAKELFVANRTLASAEELAHTVDGKPVPLEDLQLMMERVDVLLCSTGAPHYLVTKERMAVAMKSRRHRPIFLVDLTLPRNVEPAANELDGVYVYDLDDLERVAAQNRGLRQAHVEKAEAIVEEELKAYLAQVEERTKLPVLARMRAHAEQIARAELEKTLGSLQGLDEKQQKSVRAMATAIVNKLMHKPTAALREDAALGPAAEKLFGLDAAPSSSEEKPDLKLVGRG